MTYFEDGPIKNTVNSIMVPFFFQSRTLTTNVCQRVRNALTSVPVAVELYIGALETTPPAKPVLTE